MFDLLDPSQWLSLTLYVLTLILLVRFWKCSNYKYFLVPAILLCMHGIAFYGWLALCHAIEACKIPSWHDEWSAGLRLHTIATIFIFIATRMYINITEHRSVKSLEEKVNGAWTGYSQ